MRIKLIEITDRIPIGRGAIQGDTMFLKLFITALESAFKQLNWDQKGINSDGKYLNNLRFAEDKVLISNNLLKIKLMLKALQKVCVRVSLNINTKKTKFITDLVPSSNITMGDNENERVGSYVFLSYEISILRDPQTGELNRKFTLS